jgi:calcineurin-like phosphoesterase
MIVRQYQDLFILKPINLTTSELGNGYTIKKVDNEIRVRNYTLKNKIQLY